MKRELREDEFDILLNKYVKNGYSETKADWLIKERYSIKKSHFDL